MRAALVQLSSGDDPAVNLPETLGLLDRAVAEGADFVLTPEVTNCVSASRARQRAVLTDEAADVTLEALRNRAARHGVWVLIGSLALKTADPKGRFANRSFLIDPAGGIAARYDKLHMFDVQVSEGETYRESAGFRPGSEAVLADSGLGLIGLTICYDIRFPALYRQLGFAGAQVITAPSAFSPVTGAAHWETLLRGRAVETGAYILAPAQTGQHRAVQGRQRETYGHSLAVDPTGRVLADAGTEPGVAIVTLDLSQVAAARGRIPARTGPSVFVGPA